MNIIDYFDQVRIINLGTRPDRRKETRQAFRRHGLAIDNQHCCFFDAIAPDDAAGFPNRGVRGCYLSHLALLQMAQVAGAANVLVLEDDIDFARKINSEGRLAIEQLSGMDWDIAYLGHALGNQPGPPRWLAVDQPMLLAHCYAINGRTLPALTRFLSQILCRPPGHPDGGPMHYDGALNTFIRQNPALKAVYFSRNLAYQRPSSTDLHPRSLLDRNPALQPFAGLYRSLKRYYLGLVR